MYTIDASVWKAKTPGPKSSQAEVGEDSQEHLCGARWSVLWSKPFDKMGIFHGFYVFNGNSRILKWRYCTIFQAIFCGDIPLHRPDIGLIYGRYLQSRILKWPLMLRDSTKQWD